MNAADQFEVAQHTKQLEAKEHLIIQPHPRAVKGSAYGSVDGHFPSKEALANARLWAAAPELLEMLICASEHLRWYHGRHPNEVSEEEQDIMNEISDVLKKVKGEST